MIIFGFGYDKDGYNRKGFDREGYDREGYDYLGEDREGYNREGFDYKGYDRSGRDRRGYNREGYDREGYDRNGYNRKGFNRDGYNREGYDRQGFNRKGYDREGYDRDGFDKDGYDRERYGRDGFNRAGLDRKGFNRDGIDRDGFNRKGYDQNGYTRDGFDKEGYDRDGYSRKGFNREGYDRDGFNREGFDKEGYDRVGYDQEGFNREGFDRNGFDRDGFNKQGIDADGFGRDGFNSQGYNRDGYDRDGFDKDGFSRDGYNQKGYDAEGYDRTGFDVDGFDRAGFGRDGYNDRGFNVEGLHRNGSRFDCEGYDQHGLNADGLDADGFDSRGLIPDELDKSRPGSKIAENAKESDPLVRRAYLMCEDGDFAKANELIEMALNKEPENADAYVAALMVEKRVRKEEQLSYIGALDFSNISESPNYQKAMRFGPQRLKERLSAFAARNSELIGDWVVLETDAANNRQLILSKYCVSIDDSIPREREQRLRGDNYASKKGNYITWEQSCARKWMNSTYIDSLPEYIRDRLIETEIVTTGTFMGWYDLPESWHVPSCITSDRVFSLSVEEVSYYMEDERSRLARSKYYSWNTVWGLRSPGFYQVNRLYDMSWDTMLMGNLVYCYGVCTISDGTWGSAYGNTPGCISVDRYNDVGSYRPAMWVSMKISPSDLRVESWFAGFGISNLEDIHTGTTRNVLFGGLFWRVLDVIDGAALLITESIIEIGIYDSWHKTGALLWEGSKARSWLNSAFLDSLGSSNADRVLTKRNVTYDSEVVRNAGANWSNLPSRLSDLDCETTIDRVFLLDAFEAAKYFKDDADRVCKHQSSPLGWHLRSMAQEHLGNSAYNVTESGEVRSYYGSNSDIGIRPALWVRL